MYLITLNVSIVPSLDIVMRASSSSYEAALVNYGALQSHSWKLL